MYGKLFHTAGDERAMENPNLASLHALFVREHNRISERLWYLADWTKYGNQECDNDECDELLYQNTRRILIAEWQNIVYSEWLPQILGENRMAEYRLNFLVPFSYNTSVDPSIIVSFSTAAFRFGHSMINGVFSKRNPITGEEETNITLIYFSLPTLYGKSTCFNVTANKFAFTTLCPLSECLPHITIMESLSRKLCVVDRKEDSIIRL